MKDARYGHGFWPYIVPYAAFVLMSQFAGSFPDSAWLPLLAIKPLIPLGLIAFFASRGLYPELRGFGRFARGVPLDIAVGVLSGVLWMAPYLLVPDATGDALAAIEIPVLGAPWPDRSDGFDPAQAGAGVAALALGLRAFGYVLVTPLFEELFIRSFVMRFAEVYDRRGDFRDLPLARYTWRGFWISSLFFVLGHVFWEWWVAIPWVMATSAYFFWRGHLGAVIVLHAAANATILFAARWVSPGPPGAEGDASFFSLWFFV